jgi:hypothetical protein
MSGVTEVRLYRNTVNAVPSDYTNITAAALNSSTKDHATGVKRYLDGSATVSGLDPGTHYFWVELVNACGNTVGPQPAGSFTAPTVWEFNVAHEHKFARFYPEQDDVTLRRIESTFGVTVDNLTMGSG